MTAPQPKPMTPENAEKLGMILRIGGGFLILFGMVVGLDLGGLATKFGFNDGSGDNMHQLIGGMIALVGLVDFFVLPVVFKRMAAKQGEPQ